MKRLAALAAAVVLAAAGCSGGADDGGADVASQPEPTMSESPSPTLGSECVPAIANPTATTAPEFTVPANSAPPQQLVVQDLRPGTGPAAAPNSTVRAHYTGIGCLSGEKFDSSWDRGEPIDFSLQQVIPGWTQGLTGMKVGGRRLLVIPPDLGYGDMGSPPVIQPNEALVFVIDLVGVQ